MRKVSIPEDNSRKIASKSHNSYVQEGIDSHQSTQVAPSALLQPFHESLEGRLVSQFKLVKEQLKSCLGEPFYADAGFILYKGDLTQLLSNLSKSTLKIDRRFKSEVHHPGACARGAHGDNLMFSITKRNPHELLST